MQLFEMQGLLAGKCLPGDMLVGESLSEYFLRQFNQRDELARQVSALQLSQDNIINGLGIKGDGPYSQLVLEKFIALQAKCDALAAENVALISSSVCTLQDGRPLHGFYASEWFIAKLKNGEYAALKALPEEYSYDYRTNDGTYYTKDWVAGWMQTPDTEYLPNVKTPATHAAIAEIESSGAEKMFNLVEPVMRNFCNPAIVELAIEELESLAANLRAGGKG